MGVIVHPTRQVLDAVQVLEGWVKDRRLELVQIATGEQPWVAPPGEVGVCDLIVALGGDGTTLKALHRSAETHTPVLAVAYGSLGALTTVPADELRTGLDRFAAGDWRARELPALATRAGDARIPCAINDVVFARGRGNQLMVDVSVNGELYARLAGDGVVVATPVGSSAYSMAAGGSLLTEGSDGFVCTPLAMHGGCAPPLVVTGGAEVCLEVHPGHGGFHVDVDGFPVETDAEQYRVTRERPYANLVAFDDFETSFVTLRARGLIRDSPRVVGGDLLAAELAVRDRL